MSQIFNTFVTPAWQTHNDVLLHRRTRSPDMDGFNDRETYMEKYSVYRSYLFRIWKESEQGEWRASLQDIITSECHLFSGLDSLFKFLLEQTESQNQEGLIRREDLEEIRKELNHPSFEKRNRRQTNES